MHKARKIAIILSLSAAVTASDVINYDLLAESKGDQRLKITYTIDSLNKAIERSKEDTNKVKSLLLLAKAHSMSDNQKALQTAEAALNLSDKLKWDNGLAKSKNCLGLYQSKENGKEGIAQGLANCQEAYAKFVALGDKKSSAEALSNINSIYYQQRDYAKALEFANKAIELAKESDNKYVLCKTYGDLAIIYFSQNKFQNSIDNSFKALELAKEIKDYYQESRNLANLGWAYQKIPNFDKALDYSNKALEIKKNIGDEKGISNMYGLLANISLRKSEFFKAIEYYRKDLEGKLRFNDKNAAAKLYGNMATAYLNLADYPKALEYFNTALSTFESINDYQGISNTYNGLGNFYCYLPEPNYQEALKYYNKALDICVANNFKLSIANQYGNIGSVYIRQKNYQTGLEYIQKSNEIFSELKQNIGLATNYFMIGGVYKELNNYDESLENYKKSQEYSLASQDSAGYLKALASVALLNIAEVAKSDSKFKPEEKTKIISESIENYNKHLKRASIYGDKSEVRNILYNIADAYLLIEDYKNALIAFKEATNLNDSLYSIETKKQIDNLEQRKINEITLKEKEALQHKNSIQELELKQRNQQLALAQSQQEVQQLMIERKNIELNILQKDKNIQELELNRNISEKEKKEKELDLIKKEKEYDEAVKNSWIGAFLFLSIISLILLYFYRRKKKDNNLLKEQNLLITEQKEELSRLFDEVQNREVLLSEANATKDKFFSIIAHDLKNPVQTLILSAELISKNFEKYAPEQIREKLSKMSSTSVGISSLLDTLLSWSRAQTGRIDFRPEYFSIKKVVAETFSLMSGAAERKGVELVDKTSFEMDVYADLNMITTVVRNLLSNAIKFTKAGGSVTLGFENKIINGKEIAEIYIQDTGIGIDEELINKLFRIDSGLKSVGTAGEKGTGLGLILCKEFVDRHNGVIWAESVIGKGSIFRFRLPSKKY